LSSKPDVLIKTSNLRVPSVGKPNLVQLIRESEQDIVNINTASSAASQGATIIFGRSLPFD
jgi:hypothetical protein